ncbi:2Fe-2S iron-sulfur cluster-binding protein [Parasphingorhabdus sp.]|uniref:2Fe-2S iron-sulfur cluster-binding protein n=1 Tax=Parasphingorhabdus sp. TaxID=2709688 RepID=UPI003C70BFF8
MTKIVFVEHDGTQHPVEAENGISLMEAAINNSVPGIDADCGGQCACATCHVFIPKEWPCLLHRQGEMEQDMLNLNDDQQANSRLACQIEISNDLDGIKIYMPASQF